METLKKKTTRQLCYHVRAKKLIRGKKRGKLDDFNRVVQRIGANNNNINELGILFRYNLIVKIIIIIILLSSLLYDSIFSSRVRHSFGGDKSVILLLFRISPSRLTDSIRTQRQQQQKRVKTAEYKSSY